MMELFTYVLCTWSTRKANKQTNKTVTKFDKMSFKIQLKNIFF